MRFFLGLIKGAIVGGGLGFLATKMGITGGALGIALYGAVGALVGVIAGKPLWRQETLWTPAVKAIFGALIGAGLGALARKALGDTHLGLTGQLRDLGVDPLAPLADVPMILAPVVAIVYGIFVEIDDGGKSAAPDAAVAKPKK